MAALASVSGPRTQPLHWVALVLLFVGATGTQVLSDGAFARYQPATSVQWLRSPEVIRRLTLGYEALVADIYWMRAVQFYGGTRLSKAEGKNYNLLFPLLDVTTTLDPRFSIAYRFGAILLSEGYPNGPGTPEAAIALLRKGIQYAPDRWQYYHDAGFVEYWWRHDYEAASRWLLEGAALPGAPAWLRPVAATMLAEGGARNSARALWTELAMSAEHEWLRHAARHALLQLDAEAAIEQLQPIVNRYYDFAGGFPASWNDLVRVGLLRGIPLDPTGKPFALDAVSGAVDVARDSSLFPLRRNRGTAETGP